MTTRERISARRKELLLSAEQLAKMIGVSRATIYRYESSEVDKMPTEILIPLADALQTSPAWLLGVDDTPPKKAVTMTEEELELYESIKKLTDSQRAAIQQTIKVFISNPKQSKKRKDYEFCQQAI